MLQYLGFSTLMSTIITVLIFIVFCSIMVYLTPYLLGQEIDETSKDTPKVNEMETI